MDILFVVLVIVIMKGGIYIMMSSHLEWVRKHGYRLHIGVNTKLQTARNILPSGVSGLVNHLMYNSLPWQINDSLCHCISGKAVMYRNCRLILPLVRTCHRYILLHPAFRLFLAYWAPPLLSFVYTYSNRTSICNGDIVELLNMLKEFGALFHICIILQ